MDNKVVIVHNIIAPYKIVLFNELAKLLPNLHIIFIAESEKRRDWTIDTNLIQFSYNILFKGIIEEQSKYNIYRKTYKTLSEVKPDTLIICDYSNIFGWSALRWGKKNNKELVFWLDSTIDDRKHYFPKEQIKQYFLKHFSKFLAPGEKTKKYLEFLKVDSSKIIMTGYGVDNDFFNNKYLQIINSKEELSKEIGLKNKYNFIYVGRFSPEKNIFTLLNAFNKINNASTDWGLILVGDGPLKRDIFEFITNNKLKDKVLLPGFIQQNDIVKYFISSDVFILPSYSEPWGLVVNEAMLARLPILISSKCGSQPELVIEGHNGYSFDPKNIDQLINLMQKFMNGNIDLQIMGNRSFEIIKDFSLDKIAQRMKQAIKSS